MSAPRIFLDSCVLVEGIVASWSASRAVLIVGRSARFTFVLAEIVLEEVERALVNKLGRHYTGASLVDDFRLLLRRLQIEKIGHVTQEEFEKARPWMRHVNDAPVLAAAVKARPDWLLTDNTAHFDASVARKTGLRIVTPAQFLTQAGSILSPRPSASTRKAGAK